MPTGSAPSGVTGATPSVWNVPNGLTTLRILLVPVLGWLLLARDGQDAWLRTWAGLVFAAAILTDRYDGIIARRNNLITDFGKLMDPIADKALTGMAFVGLSIFGEVWWWVTIVVISREVLVTVLRFWVIRRGIIAASMGGKVKMMLQSFALFGLILPFRMASGDWHAVGQALWWVSVVLMGCAVVVTVATGVDYVGRAVRLHGTTPPGSHPAP